MSILWSRDGDAPGGSICDVCKEAVIPGTQDNDSDRELLESAGWRWRPMPPGPLDTCPDCLKKGH